MIYKDNKGEYMYNTIIWQMDVYEQECGEIDLVSNDGSIFIMVTNEFSEQGILKNNFFQIIEKYVNSGLRYINTIVCTSVEDDKKCLIPNKIYYLIWFVKDYNTMYFNKDEIREKHIWKDVEWGKRKKNYHPKGKDPGNVWIPTLDNGKGKITSHIVMTIEEVMSRCIKSTSKKGEKVFIKYFDKVNFNSLPGDREYILQKYLKRNERIIQPNYIIPRAIDKQETKGSRAKVYFKTCEEMREIESESVELMVTSPPYWDLKNYFKEGQIGHESYEMYLQRLEKVWRETYRVLKNDGSMWININTLTRNKIPILIPYDIIKQCEKIGFYLRDIIIWHKSSGIPTHEKNIVDRYEYVLWFSKSSKVKFNPDKLSIINEYKNEQLNRGNIWNINRKAGTVGKNYIHPAIYPNELITRIIELCTEKNSVILDPFLGSGTTMISALGSGRVFVGYEYNEEFEKLINYRVESEGLNKEEIEYYNKSDFLNAKDINIFR